MLNEKIVKKENSIRKKMSKILQKTKYFYDTNFCLLPNAPKG